MGSGVLVLAHSGQCPERLKFVRTFPVISGQLFVMDKCTNKVNEAQTKYFYSNTMSWSSLFIHSIFVMLHFRYEMKLCKYNSTN